MTDNDIFARYLEIRSRADRKAEEILSFHKERIRCAAGCSSCCTAITLLPVEFFAIQRELKENYRGTGLSFASDTATGSTLVKEDNDQCLFLANSLCLIYSHRPVICRTQGLPLLYFSESLENYTISVCGLNFADEGEGFEFDTDCSIDLDRLNSSLYRLNSDFLSIHPEIVLEKNRIPLSFLPKYLQ